MKPDDVDDVDPVVVRRRAMDLLARREHGRAELAAKLVARGLPGSLVESVLDRLERDGLQSDARFVENYVRSRVGKGFGPIRIQQELREKGISEDDARIVLDGWSDAFLEQARDVRRKKFGEELPRDRAGQARQMRFLSQRGFHSDLVRRVVQRED